MRGKPVGVLPIEGGNKYRQEVILHTGASVY